MMDQIAFNRLIDEIMVNGITEDVAARYAALIGDTPVTDETGAILVIDENKEIARLRLRFFQDK